MPRRSVLVMASLGVSIAFALAAWLLIDSTGRQDDPGAAAGAVAPRSGAISKYPILIPGGDEGVSGHVRWRLMSGRLDQHRDGSEADPETLELRVSVLATELSSIDTRITTESIRLLVGGKQLRPQAPISERLFAMQSVSLNDMLFLVPASSAMASLQLGTPDGGSTILALRFSK